MIEFNRGCMVAIFNLSFQLFIFSHLKRKELIIIIQNLMIPPHAIPMIPWDTAAWILLWSFWKDERDHEGCSTDWFLFSWAMLVAVASLARRLGTRLAGVTLPNVCWVGLAVFVSFQTGKWVDWAWQSWQRVCVWERQLFTPLFSAWLDWCSAWIYMFKTKTVNSYTL